MISGLLTPDLSDAVVSQLPSTRSRSCWCTPGQRSPACWCSTRYHSCWRLRREPCLGQCQPPPAQPLLSSSFWGPPLWSAVWPGYQRTTSGCPEHRCQPGADTPHQCRCWCSTPGSSWRPTATCCNHWARTWLQWQVSPCRWLQHRHHWTSFPHTNTLASH